MIGGNVYDITKYVKIHPGGVKNIMKVCGVNGTDVFTRKHAGDEKPNFMLKSMQIGVAAN
jgi:cytochrome b involved in lipid metabolism